MSAEADELMAVPDELAPSEPMAVPDELAPSEPVRSDSDFARQLSAEIAPESAVRSDSDFARELAASENAWGRTRNISTGELPEGERWQCEACTTYNALTEIACTVCFTSKMSAKDVAVTWEWQAEDSKWILYDLPTCIQVEQAYKKQLDRVALSSGFFSSQPDTYEIHFQWEGRPPLQFPSRRFGRKRPWLSMSNYCPELPCWQLNPCMLHNAPPPEIKVEPPTGPLKCLGITQVNLHSLNTRAVRRIGTDDDSIFVAVDKEQTLTDTDKCGVCQELFIEEEEEDNPPPSSSPPSVSSPSSSSPSSFPSSPSDSSSSSDSASLLPASGKGGKMCEQDVVRLAKCRNHYFHRDCIAQWVKLQHTCPFCKTPI